MAKRVPGSMRTRQQLSDLIEGRLSSSDGRAELVKLATRLIVEEALEAEAEDAIGREYYEHGDGVGAYRNGIRPGQRREPMLAAWGFTAEGRRVLLHLMAGSKEDHETVSAFFQDIPRLGPRT